MKRETKRYETSGIARIETPIRESQIDQLAKRLHELGKHCVQDIGGMYQYNITEDFTYHSDEWDADENYDPLLVGQIYWYYYALVPMTDYVDDIFDEFSGWKIICNDILRTTSAAYY